MTLATAAVSAVVLATALAMATMVPASAAPTEEVLNTRSEGALEYSKDGTTWHESPELGISDWEGIGNLSPGDNGGRTYFVRNSGTAPGTLSLRIENLDPTEGALFTVWSTIGDETGTTYIVYGPIFDDLDLGPELTNGQVLNSVELEPGQEVEVTDHIGMPEEQHKESMGSFFSADFVWSLPTDCDSSPDTVGSLGSLFGAGSLGSSADECSTPSDPTIPFSSTSGSGFFSYIG